MTYKLFGGTLSLTQSINHAVEMCASIIIAFTHLYTAGGGGTL